MRYFKYMGFIILFSMMSCSLANDDSSYFDLGLDELQVKYFETQCADPWYGIETNDVNLGQDARVGQMVSFLEQNGVEVMEVKYEFDEDSALACLACNCQTGGIFYVKINNESDLSEKLLELGFEIQ